MKNYFRFVVGLAGLAVIAAFAVVNHMTVVVWFMGALVWTTISGHLLRWWMAHLSHLGLSKYQQDQEGLISCQIVAYDTIIVAGFLCLIYWQGYSVTNALILTFPAWGGLNAFAGVHYWRLIQRGVATNNPTGITHG